MVDCWFFVTKCMILTWKCTIKAFGGQFSGTSFWYRFLVRVSLALDSNADTGAQIWCDRHHETWRRDSEPNDLLAWLAAANCAWWVQQRTQVGLIDRAITQTAAAAETMDTCRSIDFMRSAFHCLKLMSLIVRRMSVTSVVLRHSIIRPTACFWYVDLFEYTVGLSYVPQHALFFGHN